MTVAFWVFTSCSKPFFFDILEEPTAFIYRVTELVWVVAEVKLCNKICWLYRIF
jgi:hypothetical protein